MTDTREDPVTLPGPCDHVPFPGQGTSAYGPDHPQGLSVVTEDGTTETGSLIDAIVREGARRMLALPRWRPKAPST